MAARPKGATLDADEVGVQMATGRSAWRAFVQAALVGRLCFSARTTRSRLRSTAQPGRRRLGQQDRLDRETVRAARG